MKSNLSSTRIKKRFFEHFWCCMLYCLHKSHSYIIVHLVNSSAVGTLSTPTTHRICGNSGLAIQWYQILGINRENDISLLFKKGVLHASQLIPSKWGSVPPDSLRIFRCLVSYKCSLVELGKVLTVEESMEFKQGN